MQPADHPIARTLLVRSGSGSVAIAVLSAIGSGPSAFSADDGRTGTGGAESGGGEAGRAEAAGAGGATKATTSTAVTWHPADLGYVSAYVLVRAGEAAVVDTGVEDSEGAIAEALDAAGLGWDAVGHVILTHRHRDHVGSLDAVLDAAPDAAAYAGARDIPAITSARALGAVGDGDSVFGLTIVDTPGHTLGHIAVLDEIGGLLVAGDALRNVRGTLSGSNPDFTEDIALAAASVAKLGALRYETLLVGHGEPILTGASAQVAALTAAG